MMLSKLSEQFIECKNESIALEKKDGRFSFVNLEWSKSHMNNPHVVVFTYLCSQSDAPAQMHHELP